MRVLYDAKILRTARRNKRIEYFIHFLGWSSSWDRYISTDYLLHDTEENRNLQNELNTEAKKSLPKKKRKLNGSSSIVSESSRDSSEDESDDEAFCESFPVSLPENLLEKLAADRDEIKAGKRHKLPCSQDIVSILENYAHHYAFQVRFVRSCESPKRPRVGGDTNCQRKTSIELCKETVDGLRILFNHLCGLILLYDEEQEQFNALDSIVIHKDEQEQKKSRQTRELDLLLAQLEDSFIANKIPQAWDNETHRGKFLRISTQHASIASGTLKRDADDSDSATITSWTTTVTSPATSVLESVKKWRMAEDHLCPAQIYGAIHLLRLLHRVPHIVPHLKMAQAKADALKYHLDLLIKYLGDNENIFEIDYE